MSDDCENFEDEDEDEDSDFECLECGEELGDDDTCHNEQCIAYGEEPIGGQMSDAAERQWERKQMGITS